MSLKGKESAIHKPKYEYENASIRLVDVETRRLTPAQTDGYIAWLKQLVDFAEVVSAELCAIEVCA